MRKAAMVVISFRFGWLCAIVAAQTVVVSVSIQGCGRERGLVSSMRVQPLADRPARLGEDGEDKEHD